MEYIKIANNGTLDVITACNLLGASVKGDRSSAIGMFGSGLKYAMAQAARMEIDLFIASGENIYKLTTTPVEFRGDHFKRLVLKEYFTGVEHELPIATNFGEHDWTDPWFIYREVVCNAMDEGEHKVSVVTSLQRCRKETAFYLAYEPFKDIHQDLNKYFSKKKDNWVKGGTGIIYKKGVRVGQLSGMYIDMQSNDVDISESRQMDEYSARNALGDLMSRCSNKETWKEFLVSSERDRIYLSVQERHTNVVAAMRSALKSLYGKYAFSPDADNIKKDLLSQGIEPFVVPSNWTLPMGKFPSYRDTLVAEKDMIRPPFEGEMDLIAWANDLATAFGMLFEGEIHVIADDSFEETMHGQADRKTGDIYLCKSIFKDKRQFLQTYIHEVGHVASGYGDYDRGFADYFIGRIVEFALDGEDDEPQSDDENPRHSESNDDNDVPF
jgi:hypothetical protein